MTGNNKVWRAPLAGLASVAMLATMGVAAGTANANTPGHDYGFGVTLNANGGTIKGGATYTVKSSDDGKDIASDGHFDGLYNYVPTNGNQVFTGWYTAAEGGEKFDFQNSFLNKATTLYAHWSDPDDLVVVQFKLGEVDAPSSAYVEGPVAKVAGGYYGLYVSKQDGKIASWELPTDTIDKKALTGFETSKIGTAGTTAVSAETLTTGFKGILQNGIAGKQNLVISPKTTADAATVTYVYGSLGTVADKYDVAYGVTVPAVEYWDAQSNVKVTKWNLTGNKADAAYTTLSAPSTDATDTHEVTLKSADTTAAFRARFYTEINNKYAKYAEATVNKGETVKAPATPQRDGYDFVGWAKYGTNDVVDLSTLKFNQSYDFDAIWKKSVAPVTFHWNYQNKTTVQKYAGTEKFSAPTASEAPARDGFAFAGWYIDAGLTLPLTLEGAQLRWNDAYGYLEYLTVGSGANDNVSTETSKGTWVKLPTDFYAKWVQADADAVNDEENVIRGLFYVNGKDGNLKKASDQKSFTTASFEKASADWQSYLTKKTKLGPEDKDLTTTEAAELISDLKAIEKELVFNTTAPVYRLYSKSYKRHLITSSAKEAEFWKANGYASEGLAFESVNVTLLKNEGGNNSTVANLLTPVYRLYNASVDRQHLTPKADEVSHLTTIGWTDEGPAFYAPTYGDTPVYRVYIPSTKEHLWTTSAKEYNKLGKTPTVYTQEGVDFSL